MLQNIFYLVWAQQAGGSVENPQTRVIYPEEVAQVRDERTLKLIIHTHLTTPSQGPVQFLALNLDGINIYSALIQGTYIIGLILEDDDNPYDYQQFFSKELKEYILPDWKMLLKASDFSITTTLLSIYIDLRQYADEYLQPRMMPASSDIIKIFLCGLDNAGKSTLVHFLKTGQFISTLLPTRKFSIEHVCLKKGVEVVIWDMPGQDLFRHAWLKGSQDSNIFIFMIDIADSKRIDTAKIELWKMLNRFELKEVPLLLLANKLDLVNGNVRREVIQTELELNYVKNRPWNLIFTSIKEGVGIPESIDWILAQLQHKKIIA